MDTDYGWPDLSDAYADLESQIQHVHSDYPETEDEDPTSDQDSQTPTYTQDPGQIQPPAESQVHKDVRERQKGLSVIRADLAHRGGLLLNALEQLESKRDWQGELDYWVQESQEAQTGAVMTCLDLLVGVGGPVAEALQTHHFNSGILWSRYLEKKGRLESLQLALNSHRLSSAEARQAAQELTVEIGELATTISKESALISVYSVLDRWAFRVEKAVQIIEAVNSSAEKHNLLLAAHRVGEFFTSQIADMGMVKIEQTLIKEGLLPWERGLLLANFFVGYGYNSFRFYTAFNNVHTILADIDNSSATAARLRKLHSETVSQIRNIDKQLNQLKQVQDNDAQAAKLLQQLKANRRKTAFNAGIGTAYALTAVPEFRRQHDN
ncbi:hypothetical protein SKC41_19650 [Mycobacterium sp. 050128]|uniref:hypothetical protein n=1 Tax=Mycobacterium sp. 050128 TaxID=3096112 RepID=UPI002ED7C6EB